VKQTAFVCNGATGGTALVKQTPEPAGANCANGGTRIDSGTDANGNAVLDVSEISATSYACNGAPGPPGPPGTPGGGDGGAAVKPAAISANRNETCAIMSDGSGRCWGSNVKGLLGDGTTTDAALPVPVKSLTGLAAIDAGLSSSCAVTTGGAVYCWGA